MSIRGQAGAVTTFSERPDVPPCGTTGVRFWTAAVALTFLAASLTRCSDDAPSRPRFVHLFASASTDSGSARSVESDHLPMVRGDASITEGVQPWRSFDGRSPWRFFRIRNELTDKPLVTSSRPLNRALVDRSDPRLPVPPGFGAALWFDLEGRSPLWLEADGSFGGAGGLQISVLPMSDAAPPVGDRIEPGSLRERIARHGLGAPRMLGRDPQTGSRRLVLKPPPTAKGVLVLATSPKKVSHIDALRILRLSPLRSLVVSGSIGPSFVGAVDVGGIRSSAVVVPSSTAVSSEWFVPPKDAELLFSLGSLGGTTEQRTEIDVRMIVEGGQVDAFTLSSRRGRWERHVLSSPLLEAKRVRVEFVRRGPSDPDGAVVCVGVPRLFSSKGSGATKRERQPNVVLISIDTLRADRLGCYGHSGGLTPNLDALASDAVRFDRAYTHAPWTLPSHVSLFSGLLPSAHGVVGNRDRIPSGVPLVSERLRERGYRTAGFTAGGYLSAAFGQARGFDLFCEVDPLGDRYFPGHMTGGRLMGDGRAESFTDAMEWLRTSSAAPSYLLLHTFLVHCYLPERDLAEEHSLLDPDDPPLDFETVRRFEPERVRDTPLSPSDEARMIESYEATIRSADRMVGEVVRQLKEVGTYDNTLLIVTSDHGQELFDHGSTGHGVTLYEEMLRVPLIIRAPDAARGHVVRGRVRLIDVVPTVLERVERDGDDEREVPGSNQNTASFAGVTLRAGLHGESMPDRPVFASVDDPSRSIRQAVIDNDYKLVEALTTDSLEFRPRAAIELYSLDGATEAGVESSNLAGTDPKVVEALRSRLRRMEKEASLVREALDGRGEAELSGDLREILRQMGYLGG